MALKNKYVEEDHEGKLYRVRDKDFGKGEPVVVWGHGLPYDQAHLLKERVAGRELSQTVRIEDMAVAPPPTAVTPKGAPHIETVPAPVPVQVPVQRTFITVASPPAPDPVIAAAQARALSAARASATAAQQRSDLVVLPGGVPTPAAEFVPPTEAELDALDADLDALMGAESDAASE